LVLPLLLIVCLLLISACFTKPAEREDPSTTEIEEVIVDESVEHDALILSSTLTSLQLEKKKYIKAVTTLRKNGIGEFVTVKVVDVSEIPDYDIKIGIICMAEIQDDSGRCYRVGFSENVYPLTIYPPTGPSITILPTGTIDK